MAMVWVLELLRFWGLKVTVLGSADRATPVPAKLRVIAATVGPPPTGFSNKSIVPLLGPVTVGSKNTEMSHVAGPTTVSPPPHPLMEKSNAGYWVQLPDWNPAPIVSTMVCTGLSVPTG